MIRFLVRAFAVIGFLFVLLIAGGIALGYYTEEHQPGEPDALVLTLNFDAPIVEQVQTSALDIAIHENSTSLFDILHAIDTAKDDPHVKGIVARFGDEQPALTQVQEIRAALARFRASGKFTYAFAPSYGNFGLGGKAYYLASAFENIWLQPVGSVGLSGLSLEMPFAKTALDKYGVTASFFQREEYKSAMDNLTRDSFAPQVRVEMQAMVDELAGQIAGGIAESRKWSPDRAKHVMEEGPYTDNEAFKSELITKIGYRDELDKEIEGKTSKDVAHASVEEYLGYEHKEKGSAKDPTTVALIYGTGMIVDKTSGASNAAGEHMMSAEEIAGAFDDAATDKNVKAVLFRVDSPGGSPEASETIRRALVHAQKEGKPVIVSMGELAASGGYWISMNADHIIAEPATLTGSIGVVGGKFVLGGLMKKFDVNWETVKTDANAGMWSMASDFSPAQRDRVNALMDQTYHAFVKNVSDARHIPMEKMPDIAKGRVWTGSQAIKIGLVDDLGGYDIALGAVRKSLKLGEKDPLDLVPFPAPESTVEKVMKLLKNVGGESAMLGPMLMEWQKISAMLMPFAARTQPVEMRMSPLTVR